MLRRALPLLCAALLATLLATLLAPRLARAQSDWQQEVAYEMDITLKADRHRMRGTQRLAYTNNAPDTLRHVFYHLYFNAFNPQSMMAERNRHLPDPDGRIVPRIFNLGPDEIGYHRIQSLTQDGQPVAYDVDGTVMEVTLAEPIAPGETSVFEMRFRSQVPLQTRRSGRDNAEGIDYSMTQWYPKMAEYDEYGWHADPYVGREFYAPYGSFDVQITLPARYTIGATGALQNARAVGHGYDRRPPALWRPSERSAAPGDSLTWHFQAQDVHDFAWAADPDFLHECTETPGGTAIHLFYQPGVEERWTPMSDWVPAIIDFYGEQYGAYPYPQFTVAQGGDGGMEYPMLNLITGRRSPGSLLGVTAHEAAHEWFYATLGSNETSYAWMDEGFTSYASAEAFAHVTGSAPADHSGAYLSVLAAQDRGLFERLNTPADWFQTNAGYGTASYPGGEMLVDMLGYVIGEANRDRFLREYFRRYKFDHPHPRDLEKIAEDVSGLQLDWYFEQFLNTTRHHDYALDALKAERGPEGGWIAEVTLERNDPIVVPADVRIELEDGSAQWATVPLSIMEGHKPVPDDWTVAEAWPWTFPEHTIRVEVPRRPVKAEVDPRGETPDENRLNNSTRFRVEPRFLQPPGQSWANYRLGYRPLLQYAHDFGPGAGLQARGQYLFGDHRVRAMLKLWPQPLFTGGEEPDFLPESECNDNFLCLPGPDADPDVSFFDGIDYEVAYQTEVPSLGVGAQVGARAEKHLGVLENTLFFERPLAPYGSDAEQRLSLAVVHQLNPSDRVFGDVTSTFRSFIVCDFAPCELPDSFTQRINPFQREHMLSARADYDVTDGGDYLSLMAEAGASLRDGPSVPISFLDDDGSDLFAAAGRQNALRVRLDAGKSVALSPLLTGRADVSLGLGAPGLALHKQFRLGAASFEERWRDDAFRTTAAAFANPVEEAHLVAFQGAGPVAYAGRSDLDGGSEPLFLPDAETGRNLLAGSVALTAGPFGENEYVRPFRLELFSGIGGTWSDGPFLSGIDSDDVLADAGFGARYDLSALPVLGEYVAQSDVMQGLQLVAKFPVWASDPQRIERGADDEWAFRWRLGLEVAP